MQRLVESGLEIFRLQMVVRNIKCILSKSIPNKRCICTKKVELAATRRILSDLVAEALKLLSNDWLEVFDLFLGEERVQWCTSQTMVIVRCSGQEGAFVSQSS